MAGRDYTRNGRAGRKAPSLNPADGGIDPTGTRETSHREQSATSVPMPTELQVEQVALDGLKPHPANARTHTRKQIRQIADSFRRFRFNGAIVINASNTIIAGHGRVEAARLIGLDCVSCVRVRHLSEPEERAYALADNKIASNAGWDRSRLAIELKELDVLLPSLDDPLEIGITGFEMGEIDALMVDLVDDETDPADDITAPVDAEPVTRKGDLWLFDNHRLICGDARCPETYSALMAGKSADMSVSDPLFNVRIDGHVSGRGKRKHEEFAFAAGEMHEEEYRNFLVSFLQHTAEVSRDGALIYAFMDWRYIEALCSAGGMPALSW